MDHLTKAQTRVLDAIRTRLDGGNAPPTYRELQKDLGFSSTASVRDHLRALERKGFVKRGGGRFRNIRLLRNVAQSVSVPILGCVVAGFPTPAQQNLEGFIDLPADWVKGDSFALRVTGDSMEEAGILDGDIAIVRRDLEPLNGQVVCATLDGESTLKTFRVGTGRVWLVPANPRYPKIPLQDNAVIQGVLQATIRKYDASRVRYSRTTGSPQFRTQAMNQGEL